MPAALVLVRWKWWTCLGCREDAVRSKSRSARCSECREMAEVILREQYDALRDEVEEVMW